MAFYKGSIMRIQIGDKIIKHEQDATFNASSDFKEISSSLQPEKTQVQIKLELILKNLDQQG